MQLDPVLVAYFADLEARGVPKAHEVPPDQARSMFELRHQAMREREVPPELADVSDRTIPGPDGKLTVRVYRPRADADLPTVLYLHGGGWVICDIETHDGVCRRLADCADAVVVSLDYRLAPEHPFPAAVDDALAGARWVREHRHELGGTDVWGSAGDSAGATLMSVTAHTLRDAGEQPAMAAQLFFYPAVDAATTFPSRQRFGVGYGLESETIDHFLRLYAGDADPADPRISPLRFSSHADLPPTLVVAAGFDPLVDESHAYVGALRDAGVPVELHEALGLVHGFVDLGPLVPAAAQALERAGRRFGQMLRR